MPISHFADFVNQASGEDRQHAAIDASQNAVAAANAAAPGNAAAMIAAVAAAKNANPTEIEKQQLKALQQSNDISSAMWDRYKSVYEPLQDKVINDANTVDSDANQGVAAGRANADVTGAFERTRQASLERLRSMGVNPDSGAFIDANMRLAGSEGAANAGAQNTARELVKAQGRQLRSQAAGVGTNMPQMAATGLTQGASGLGSAAQGVQGTNAGVANGVGQLFSAFAPSLGTAVGGVRDWMNNSGGGVTNKGTNYGSGVANYGMGSDPYGNSDSFSNSEAGGQYGGTDSYGFADGGVVRPGYVGGGVVRGPGTGTSDSIASRPAAGSMIIPADVVRAKGEKFFDKLLEKHGVRPTGGGVSIVGGVPAHLSNGEYEVPAIVVRREGIQFFNKLIQQYHAPVRRGVRR